MLRRFAAVLAGAVVLVAAVRNAAPAADAHAELFSRMVAVNRGLHSSTSRVHVDVALHTFPFISPKLEGTAYYKAPNRSAVNFDSVPALAALFKKVYPKIDPPGTWPKLYRIAYGSATPQTTMLRLEPRKQGNIEYIDVAVDNAAAYPIGYTYHYRSGGTVHFDITVLRREGFLLVDTVRGKVDLPSTNADAVSSFSGYHVNVPVDDAVFREPAS